MEKNYKVYKTENFVGDVKYVFVPTFSDLAPERKREIEQRKLRRARFEGYEVTGYMMVSHEEYFNMKLSVHVRELVSLRGEMDEAQSRRNGGELTFHEFDTLRRRLFSSYEMARKRISRYVSNLVQSDESITDEMAVQVYNMLASPVPNSLNRVELG